MRSGNYCNKHYLKQYLTPQTHKRRRRKLAQELSHVLEISFDEATKIIRAVQISMTEALKRGETVQVRGFGVFDFKQSRRQLSKSPVYFKPSRELTYMVKHPDWRPNRKSE